MIFLDSNLKIKLNGLLKLGTNESFFGDMQETSAAIANDTNIDDPSLVLEGLPFMSRVAAASVSSFMFHIEVMNFNQSRNQSRRDTVWLNALEISLVRIKVGPDFLKIR